MDGRITTIWVLSFTKKYQFPYTNMKCFLRLAVDPSGVRFFLRMQGEQTPKQCSACTMKRKVAGITKNMNVKKEPQPARRFVIYKQNCDLLQSRKKFVVSRSIVQYENKSKLLFQYLRHPILKFILTSFYLLA